MRKALVLLLVVLLVFTMAVSGCTAPEGAIQTSGEASQAITDIGEGVSDVGEILEDLDRKLS